MERRQSTRLAHRCIGAHTRKKGLIADARVILRIHLDDTLSALYVMWRAHRERVRATRSRSKGISWRNIPAEQYHPCSAWRKEEDVSAVRSSLIHGSQDISSHLAHFTPFVKVPAFHCRIPCYPVSSTPIRTCTGSHHSDLLVAAVRTGW